MQSDIIDKLRGTIRSGLLKNVLIRIDYTGINNIDTWIEEKQDFLSEYFSCYERGSNNNAKVEFTNIDDIAKSLSLPVSEIRKETIHSYSEWRKGNTDDVRLSITSYYITLNIVCNNYTTIDNYLDFISLYISAISSKYSFLTIQRVGIRKIGGKSFPQIDDMCEIYRPELFFGEDISRDSHPLQREYSDMYLLNDNSLKVNYRRLYKCQKMREEDRHLTLLDLDCYVDQYNIGKYAYDIKRDCIAILKMLNTHLFQLFYDSVQVFFIEKCQNEA